MLAQRLQELRDIYTHLEGAAGMMCKTKEEDHLVYVGVVLAFEFFTLPSAPENKSDTQWVVLRNSMYIQYSTRENADAVVRYDEFV
jgi:hypothetical protein